MPTNWWLLTKIQIYSDFLSFYLVSFFWAIYLFSHWFISVWNHGYLFYTLSYNPVLLYFVGQIVPALTMGALSAGSCVPLRSPPSMGWFVLFCLVLLRQAGTLCCSACTWTILEQQNTKKLWGTKNRCVHAQLGQIMDNKIQKDQKPNCHFWRARGKNRVSGAKAGYFFTTPCPLHTTPKGGAKHLSHSSCPIPGYTPTLTPYKEPAHPTSESKQGKLLLVFASAAAAGAPVKPCLHFLSGLLSISID